MQTILNHPCRVLQIAAAMFPLVFAASVRSDIFQWEYINPADPSQGKQQSTTLCPSGAGVDAVPGADLTGRDLTMAYLIGADLSGAEVSTNFFLSQPTVLTGADLSHANLTNAFFPGAILTGADFTDAEVQGADFFYTGLTLVQLYSTASYQAHDLSGIGLSGNDLAGGNFASQNLTNANLGGATLTGANFADAEVRGAELGSTGITLAQLYVTASYQAYDLSGIRLTWNNLAGANFAEQNLSGANFSAARLTNGEFRHANLTNATFSSAGLMGVDFTDAEVRGANFSKYSSSGSGIVLAQLYSTASYHAHDLTGIGLAGNDVSGGNFVGQNLTSANFGEATLTDADITGAEVRGADFQVTTSKGFTAAQLYSTASYQAHDLTGIHLGRNDLSGWNFAGQNLTNANFFAATLIDADVAGAGVRGASFDRYYGGTGITPAQLYSTASYQAHDLSGIDLGSNNLASANFAGQTLFNAGFGYVTLTGANFAEANLTKADFGEATLTSADFTGANVQGARFRGRAFYYPQGTGISPAQLYSTASYHAHDLTGIRLYGDLSGWNFAGQNLTSANFYEATLTGANFRQANLVNANFTSYACDTLNPLTCSQRSATLTGANFTAADARGAVFYSSLSDAITTNLIRFGGHIFGLDLDAGGLLVVRDYDGDPARTNPFDDKPAPVPSIPITVDQHFAIDPAGTLRIVFEKDAWGSTISFAPSIPVALGGTLELTFAADVNLASQVGRTFDLFDWTGVAPTGTFAISSPYAWDLSHLYTTGEVTLTAVPEPATFGLLFVGVLTLANRRASRTGKHKSQWPLASQYSSKSSRLQYLHFLLSAVKAPRWEGLPSLSQTGSIGRLSRRVPVRSSNALKR